jgi:hypothetical protein
VFVRFWTKADIGPAPLINCLSANDPLRPLASISCCSSETGFSPYQKVRLSAYHAAT